MDLKVLLSHTDLARSMRSCAYKSRGAPELSEQGLSKGKDTSLVPPVDVAVMAVASLTG